MAEGSTNEEIETEILPYTLGQEFIIPFSSSSDLIFYYEAGIDMSGFNQGKAEFVPTLDMRKLSQFSVTNRGVNEDMLKKDYLNKLKQYQADHEAYAYIDQLLENRQLKPVDVKKLGKTAYHGGVVIFSTFWRELLHDQEDQIRKMKERGIYGRADGLTYITVDMKTALVHAKSTENSPDKHGIGDPKTRFLLLTINLKKLAQKRNVFIDPESLQITPEFMKNFVVHKGIPVSAIERLDLMQFRGFKEKGK